MFDKLRFLKKPKYTAFFAAVLFGFLIHLFGLVTIVHNYDDIAVNPVGFGSSVQSGRWGLGVLGGVFHLLFGSYNIPFLYGLIFLFFIGLSVAMIVTMFDIKSHKLAIIIGALFVVFPTATSTMFFKYTAHYYAVAIFLAVWAAKKLAESKRGFILGTLFIVLSLSIYQAYLPLTIGLLVLFLLKRILEDDSSTFVRTIQTGLFFCLSIITAFILYRLSVELSIVVGNKVLVIVRQAMPSIVIDDFVLSSYQGINSMGNITVSSLFESVIKSFKLFFTLPIEDYCGLASTVVLKILYPVFWLLTVIICGVVLGIKKRKLSHIFGVLLLLVLFPLAVNFIVVMCPNSLIYTLMVYSFVLVPCAPILLIESWNSADSLPRIRVAFKRILASVSIFMIAIYSVSTTVNYTYMYYQTRQAENYVASLVTQIRMTEDFSTDKPWAFIGSIEDPLLNSGWASVPTYGGSGDIKTILNSYSRNEWIKTYIGYTPTFASNGKVSEIKATEEFKSMPIWPNEGSIRVINECVVVRFE